MPDKTDPTNAKKRVSRTGEVKQVDPTIPLARQEGQRPMTLPEIDVDDVGSTTGAMPVQSEADDDDSADRDDDMPAET